MAYRSRIEIQASVLEAAIGGAAKTRVMYSAELSYFQMSSYLEELVGTGLMDSAEASKLYATTQKGNDFLRSYRQLTVLIHG
ncbi:MAG: winged helix-turn-helix domain-containing protein [Nitrososphaera sp.]